MANDFDQFPLYDPLIKKYTEKMADTWVSFMATFYQNIVGYLTQNGILLPNLTTTQRDAIVSPQGGQMIYNTTLGTAQYFKAGVWTSF
jgi:hypothetical protein